MQLSVPNLHRGILAATEQVPVPVRNVLLRSLMRTEFVVPGAGLQNASCLQPRMPPNPKLQYARNLNQKM